MHSLSVCLIIKNEGEYLQEWLDWHAAQGVEHFYIYDNGSDIPVRKSIQGKHWSNCTVIDAPDMTQTDAYVHCLDSFGSENEWIAFIDTDEFIRIKDGRTIKEFLREFSADVDAVALKWVVYGADGQREKRAAPVRERFRRAVDTYPSHLPQTKCIVRPGNIECMGAHFPFYSQKSHPFLVVNECGEVVYGALSEAITNDIAVVDHYFTRSLEEWTEKIGRGSCDPYSHRQFDLFYSINPDMRGGKDSED